ncbi:MAG TPA: hypothetical protein VK783_00980 [Bacteroidia bacterium]|jgi:hypothetical protein|nr:hypothetical protein [Bacteroidia bacterium]
MKRLVLFFLFFLPFMAECHNITSTTTGGSWNVGSTWVGGSAPSLHDTVTIAGNVTYTGGNDPNILTVNNSYTLTISSTFGVYNKVINNGSISGTGVLFVFVPGSANIVGAGSWTGYSGNIRFQPSGGGTFTIDSTVNMVSSCSIIYNGSSYFKINNKGTVELTNTSNGYIRNFGTNSTCWINAKNATLEISYNYFGSKDTLNATATGNTVIFNSTATIKEPANNTFYNLTFSGTAATSEALVHNLSVTNTLQINSTAYLDLYGDSIFVSGSWSNSGSVINTGGTTNSTSIIKVSGTTVLSIPPPPTKIVSTSTGGNWSATSTWVGGVIPCGTDTAEIAGSVTVNQSIQVNKILVDAGKTFTVSAVCTISGILTNNGSVAGGAIHLTGSGTVLSGGGSWSSFTGAIYYAGTSQIIASNVHFVSTNSFTELDDNDINGPVTVYNYGHYDIGMMVPYGTSYSTTWVNEANAFTHVEDYFQTGITLNASAPGDTIEYGYVGGTGSTIIVPVGGAYYNLTTIGNNPKAVAGDFTATNVTLSSSCVVNMGGHNVTVSGNWINDDQPVNITNNTGTITFNGTSGSQTIGGSQLSTFNNLTINSSDTVYLASPDTVKNNLTITSGILNCKTNKINGNSSGSFTIASSGQFIMGLTSSGTVPAFPTNYTTAHISFDPNSTVVYQSNANQTISNTPSAYGNLVLSTGSSTSIKTTASSSMTVAGNLTINNNTTLSGLSSGTLTLGGNLTDNGTYTVGTGTVTLNGSGTQTIGGSSHISFNNLSLSGTGTVNPTYNLTIAGSLTISSGTFDMTTNNYNINIAGNFTNTGGTFNPHSDTLTMNGSSVQTLGGTSTITMNNLVIGTSGTTTLGGNITTASNVTVNSGATLNGASYTLTTAGNFIDNGTFYTPSTSTVYFNKNGHQCVLGTSVPTFQNITVGSLSILAAPNTMHIYGNVVVLPGGWMACNCGP